MIKNILWDFDGVIIDSMPTREVGFREILKEHPEALVETLIAYHHQNGGLSRFHKIRYFFNTLLEQDVSEEMVQAYAENFSTIMKRELTDPKYLIEETHQYLQSHHQQFNFHIVSGSEHKELNYLCHALHLDGFFHSIDGSPTPKNELVKHVLEHCGYRKDETILIGDSINDYEAARVNEIVFYGYNNPELMHKDQYIDDFSRLPF